MKSLYLGKKKKGFRSSINVILNVFMVLETSHSRLKKKSVCVWGADPALQDVSKSHKHLGTKYATNYRQL